MAGRTVVIQFRITEEERDSWKEEAVRAGNDLSDWCRAQCRIGAQTKLMSGIVGDYGGATDGRLVGRVVEHFKNTPAEQVVENSEALIERQYESEVEAKEPPRARVPRQEATDMKPTQVLNPMFDRPLPDNWAAMKQSEKQTWMKQHNRSTTPFNAWESFKLSQERIEVPRRAWTKKEPIATAAHTEPQDEPEPIPVPQTTETPAARLIPLYEDPEPTSDVRRTEEPKAPVLPVPARYAAPKKPGGLTGRGIYRPEKKK